MGERSVGTIGGQNDIAFLGPGTEALMVTICNGKADDAHCKWEDAQFCVSIQTESERVASCGWVGCMISSAVGVLILKPSGVRGLGARI